MIAKRAALPGRQKDTGRIGVSRLFAIIASHISEIYDPSNPLADFLTEQNFQIFLIRHFQPITGSRTCIAEFRVGRRILQHRLIHKFGRGQVISALEDVIVTILLSRALKQRVEVYVGIGLLNALSGLLLRTVGLVQNVVFYSFDHGPRRYENAVSNRIYHTLDGFCARRSNRVWNASKRMAEMRRTLGLPDKKNLIVPIVVDVAKAGPDRYRIVREKRIVYVGYLSRTKGIELILDALPELAKEFPDLSLDIIGAGPEDNYFRRSVLERAIQEHVNFRGIIAHDELLQVLPSYRVGLALYTPDIKNLTRYGDAIKPKEYMACGVPVIITKVPTIAEEVERRRTGLVIDYEVNQLVHAIKRLLTDDELYSHCKQNAIEFSGCWDSNRSFREALASVLDGEQSD